MDKGGKTPINSELATTSNSGKLSDSSNNTCLSASQFGKLRTLPDKKT